MQPDIKRHHQQITLRSLWLFIVYRIVLSTSILMVTLLYPQYFAFGQLDPVLFKITIFIFTTLTYLSAFVMLGRLFSLTNQSALMIFIDIVALTILTFASGGVASGLGAFIAVTIAIGSLIISSRQSLALTAIASSLLLSQEIYLHQVTSISPEVTKAGMLGLAYFAITALAYVLSKQAWESEKKALTQKKELKKMARLNEQIIQEMSSGVIIINQYNHVFLANKSALMLLNLSQYPGRMPLSYYSTALAKLVEEWRYSSLQTKNTFKSSNNSITVVVSFRNITHENDSAALLLLSDAEQVTKQAQQLKLASLGQLTASIAHEIRNPLSSIGHAGQLLSESEKLSSEDRRLLDIMVNNVTRLNDIIENILQLSRSTDTVLESTNLHQMLTSFTEQFILSKQLNAQQLQIKNINKSLQILTNSQQIQQVLTVLCDNAVNHFNDKAVNLMIKITGSFNQQGYFNVTICDNNSESIGKELSEKIFEPFYSTKHTGTGLGLYVARGLCEANSAGLDYIKSGVGNCFSISFHPSKIVKS